MSSWLVLVALAMAALACLHFVGVRGRSLQLVAAALAVGGVGYGLQGHPGLPGAPAAAEAVQPPLPLSEPRQAFFGRFSAAERWLVMSDALASRGDTRGAAGIIRSALKARPRDAELWTAYGNALVDHADGQITPGAELAYSRAEALAPNHPGPLFFHGLALGRSGRSDAAIAKWNKALVLSPEDAPWTRGLVMAIAQVQGLSAPPSDNPAAASPPSEGR